MRAWIIAVLLGLGVAGCADSGAHSTSDVAEAIVEAPDFRHSSQTRVALPNEERSIKFAVIGDSGRGSLEQQQVAGQMVAFRQRFDYRFVLMAGDNIYEGAATPEDYRLKFEEPYKLLLDAGVKFYAVLGNHDDPAQVHYKPFNMDGHRYYTFTPPVDIITRLDTRVRFFAIDSTNLDGEQMKWLEQELGESQAEWKIALLHYPLYTSGRYELATRAHRFAVRIRVSRRRRRRRVLRTRAHLPALGVRRAASFISSAAAPARFARAMRNASSNIAKSFDTDYHFMLVEITDEGFFFQAIDRKGNTVDAGALRKVASDVTRGTAAHR